MYLNQAGKQSTVGRLGAGSEEAVLLMQGCLPSQWPLLPSPFNAKTLNLFPGFIQTSRADLWSSHREKSAEKFNCAAKTVYMDIAFYLKPHYLPYRAHEARCGGCLRQQN